jgi:hypothetical protein
MPSIANKKLPTLACRGPDVRQARHLIGTLLIAWIFGTSGTKPASLRFVFSERPSVSHAGPPRHCDSTAMASPPAPRLAPEATSTHERYEPGWRFSGLRNRRARYVRNSSLPRLQITHQTRVRSPELGAGHRRSDVSLQGMREAVYAKRQGQDFGRTPTPRYELRYSIPAARRLMLGAGVNAPHRGISEWRAG